MLPLTLADISRALTETVVDRAFKVKTESADTVQRISVTRAAPAGEGLIGAVYRIHVVGEHNQASFVAKALVKDELLCSTLNCPMYFKREVIFFSKILPTLVATQKSLGATENLQSYIPVCFDWHCDGRNDFLLLEDLAERGYVSIQKNLTICKKNATLKTLAHFHAVSLALRVKKPDVFKKIADELDEIYYFEENRTWYDEYLQEAIKIDVATLAEYENPETSIYYKKLIELLNKNAYTLLINLASERGSNPVICHGDAWCCNFMYSNEKTVAIDFQITRCASLVTDLSYFILVSNSCRNKDDFNEAVEVYYLALKYYLSDMKLDANEVFPKTTLEAELRRYGKYGLLACLTSFPLLASERCDVLQSYSSKYQGYDRIPLLKLWYLTPFQTEEDKTQVVNAVRVAVDVGII
ncbi:uncharacterized protein [Epargyreus clarus]|uniref:uncharacterized protein n=1 Tax=Epargyreus clarus TaxID=520877 RepID=UPI003C2BDE0B